jgi:hypothetical protein
MKTPTMEEIEAFCVSIGLQEMDGQYIFWHWVGNGWTRAGKKIKNWKACCRTWQLGGYFPSQRDRFMRKPSAPSAHDVRRVIREHRDRMVGCQNADAAWERIFQTELQCSREEAMKALETMRDGKNSSVHHHR